ncbi:MAG: hypothetical protein RL477_2006 [Pseudomonadota bacterium]
MRRLLTSPFLRSRPPAGGRGGRLASGRKALALPAFAGLDEPTVLAAALALAFFATIAACALALNLWRSLVRLRRARAAERARALGRGAALATAPGGYWTWPVADAPAAGDGGEGGGALARLLGVDGATLARFEDVARLLRSAQGEEILSHVARLRESGEGFTLKVETADGRHVFEARGRRASAEPGGKPADTVWLQDIGDAVHESARLMERVSALGLQNTGLRHVLDGLAIPVWVRGPDLAIVYCNRAYSRAVDDPAPAASVASGKEIAAGPVGWGRKLGQEAAASGMAQTNSLHVVVEGRRRLLEITEFPIGSEGSSWRVAGIAVDRTDADDARAELVRHVAAHAEVLEKLGTGMVIFGPDARLQFFNAAFAGMWRFDPEWLHTGPTHGEMLEDLRARRMYPEQTDFQDYKRRRLDLYTSLIDTQEELLYLPDNRVVRLVISPHPLGGLMFTSEDVTDRLTLERSYNTLIAVQSETLNNLHEGVAVYGSDGRLKLYNPAFARIWRLRADLLDGEPRMADVVDAARELFLHRGRWEDFRDQVIANGADRAARAGRFERADGSILDYAAVPLPDGAMLFTYIDVTDSVAVQRALRERNEALLAADRLKSEFITNVSYELRTPLNTIIGFTEILANQYFGTLNRRQSEYAGGVLESSQQLLTLIDDILDLALIESGRFELDLGEADIRAALDSVLALARENARKRGLAMVVDCPSGIGSFVADDRRIRQSLFNLVSNAIKFTPAEGRITLSARREADQIVLSVSDTGPGIPEEDRERVFGKFERGRGSDGRDGDGRGGVGLGLALVKSVVDLHGGSIGLQSEVGQGTTVTLRLPAVPPADRPRATGAAAPWADPGGYI